MTFINSIQLLPSLILLLCLLPQHAFKLIVTANTLFGFYNSFNDKSVNEAVVGPIGKELFEKEQDDLLANLIDIPKKACDRRVNEFVKCTRAAKIHAYIISQLRKEMSS
ncbi:EH domain-containing protein 1-like [Rhododendron vialii]|uniref:EH domain-containing protein 1-like n=1 Tax=Rhododendron vialii TaxID=182163 RepID=UPI00265E6D41|nr:EH domain-containing protein 1-like [Rhododendron vialii]